MGKTLYEKVWEAHAIRELPDGRTQLFIDLHLIHEVTSPQAFAMLKERGLKVAFPHRTFATVDHIVPTDDRTEPFKDPLAQAMLEALRKNTAEHGIPFFDLKSGRQGIVHVIGPELGLTQPGFTIVCGDSHTSTHGAFGAIAFGIGTTQVRDVLATQTVAMQKLKVRRIEVNGRLLPGVTAKDVILHVIRTLGVKGGIGYAYEYAGEVIERMSMDERMTVANMSIEGGARIGYMNPDETTFAYLKGRPYAPKGEDWERAVAEWRALASDPDARYDDRVELRGEEIPPTVTWGVHPGQSAPVDGRVPDPADFPEAERAQVEDALRYMKLRPGQKLSDVRVDVAFLGSCTNARLSDLRLVARYLEGRRVAKGVRALVVPGSQLVAEAAEREGIADVFRAAGFEWRAPGCSMCLAMNPDRLVGDELAISASNRNYKGRQGSPTGRTVLASPLTVAASAVAGHIADPREVFGMGGEDAAD
ncbi:MAG TPA: 3-isopropylmalate dehydratase large subunit [Oceanithermus sp.]|nr:3-isopropylmalate dehydratase large subunit [Oceanithermus sp.]